MDFDDPLEVEYTAAGDIVDLIEYCAETISLEFDRWDDEYAHGPGLYFVLVSGARAADYADPLGENRWPVEEVRSVDEVSEFVEAARSVAFERDGAVIVSTDGTIQERMVRVKGLSDDEVADVGGIDRIQYAEWMGTRHLSAVESSIRDEVIAAVTLSEETGRVTVFEDGRFRDRRRAELGGAWRTEV